MSDDALEAPQWDDAVSASPGKFHVDNERVTDELSSTLASTALSYEEPEEEVKDHDEPQKLRDQEATTEDPTEPEEHVPDSEELNKTPKKDTSGLLSDLTKGADKGFISEVVSPKKDEALFKGTNVIDTDGNDSEHSKTLASPTKLRRQNVYRAPRLRRVPLKTQSIDETVSKSKSTDSTSNSDELGPLGAAPTEENISTDAPTTATDDIAKLADAPLFEINRTPLSPLKKLDGRIQSAPSTDNSSRSKGTSPYGAEIEAAKQRYKAKQHPEIKMDISVGDPIKVGELTGAHIVYSVRTDSPSELFRAPQIVVSRRYRDFRWLYRQLQSTHPGRIIPPPPDKQAVGRFNEDFIEGRRFALERMLVKISESPALQKDPDFLMFLQSERFTSEAREREKAASAQSIFTEHDADSLNNSSGGLFGSLGGTFSFQPKVVEPDPYFKDKKDYIEALDQQFKVFLKNLETIVVQRNDLSSVTDEFANIVLTLADLEVSKSTTEIFQEFSNTQKRIKELLDRLSLQDMLTLGSTLDEYQRVIASVKTTFEQREKLLLHLANCDSDLKKKQASLDKYVKYNTTQTEKIEIIKNELNALEQKNKNARERFETISETIKEELANFEVEKIHDFRNSIEIYLESSIESQKEAVELWETFYNITLSSA
ncbi:Vacuolar protein sorting-associated protein 5 [Cyberlindnera fabianii]|uniref:Vacuolar protein sorting-associated protein 5 n=1 Tax=Cyberlindnera fabianii TaxID=36022 RepID=A0A1V2LCQ5_CYBFA|nr:Vacuolar protein sorting-associated protein 5 [Cyberlindnera fabianii]